MLDFLINRWWILAIRGVAAVLFGVFAFFSPHLTLGYLLSLFGIFALADGFFTMGAAIALQVAAHNPWIRAVWADSPFASLRRIAEEFVKRATHLPGAVLNPVLWTTIQVANYRGKFDVHSVDPLALAAQIKCPVYLVHGTADQLIAPVHSENIHGALGGEKDLWFVDGARHARSIRFAKHEYSERLTRFFKDRLGA